MKSYLEHLKTTNINYLKKDFKDANIVMCI